MKHLLVLCIFYAYQSFAQVKFEPGYIRTSGSEHKAVMIKNYGSNKNPEQIQYQLNENENIFTANPEEILEFGIGEQIKYLSSEVEVDESSDLIRALDAEPSPKLVKHKVFLRKLLEGPISLFELITSLNSRYYYLKDGQYHLLIYKEFLTANGSIGHNENFKTQLYKEFACTANPVDILKLKYTQPDLVLFFENYNTCLGRKSIIFKEKKKEIRWAITPSIGVDRFGVDFGSVHSAKYNFRPSAEIEISLPINQYKWSVLLEGAYQKFISDPIQFSQSAHWEYNGLETSLGVRHSIFLPAQKRMLLQFHVVTDFPFENSIVFESNGPLTLNQVTVGFSAGFGIKLNRVLAQFRWYSGRNLNGFPLPQGLINDDIRFDKLSICLGYSLFQKK